MAQTVDLIAKQQDTMAIYGPYQPAQNRYLVGRQEALRQLIARNEYVSDDIRIAKVYLCLGGRYARWRVWLFRDPHKAIAHFNELTSGRFSEAQKARRNGRKDTQEALFAKAAPKLLDYAGKGYATNKHGWARRLGIPSYRVVDCFLYAQKYGIIQRYAEQPFAGRYVEV